MRNVFLMRQHLSVEFRKILGILVQSQNFQLSKFFLYWHFPNSTGVFILNTRSTTNSLLSTTSGEKMKILRPISMQKTLKTRSIAVCWESPDKIKNLRTWNSEKILIIFIRYENERKITWKVNFVSSSGNLRDRHDEKFEKPFVFQVGKFSHSTSFLAFWCFFPSYPQPASENTKKDQKHFFLIPSKWYCPQSSLQPWSDKILIFNIRTKKAPSTVSHTEKTKNLMKWTRVQLNSTREIWKSSRSTFFCPRVFFVFIFAFFQWINY